jgi:hypothetical protein
LHLVVSVDSYRRAAKPVPSPAAQRKQRLLELENEQRLEDAEALKFTDVRLFVLCHSTY